MLFRSDGVGCAQTCASAAIGEIALTLERKIAERDSLLFFSSSSYFSARLREKAASTTRRVHLSVRRCAARTRTFWPCQYNGSLNKQTRGNETRLVNSIQSLTQRKKRLRNLSSGCREEDQQQQQQQQRWQRQQ